jgi:putative spermidine/putrescine transport system ATP-binding protein
MLDSRSRGAGLELRGLVKHYGRERALDDVSLAVEPGEFLTLLGPSGSGKTTTLNAIAGFVELTSGEILLDGSPIANLPPHKRNIGVVFQHYALFPHMTVFDNVAFSLRQRKVAKRETTRLVEEALNLVDLTGYARRYPAQLSGGQQQRVALARAIVFKPPLLLMDEPLGALDRKLRDSLQVELRRLHRELGITFIYVTHDQDEALALSQRIAVFSEGKIEQVGTPDQLYEQPETLFVARFVGESNVFVGEAAARGDRVVVEGAGFVLAADRRFSSAATGRCAMVVRPEAMSVAPVRTERQDNGEDANVLAGELQDKVYLGASVKLYVHLDCGQIVVVRRPTMDAADLATEQRVEVTWSVSQAVVVPQSPAEADSESIGASRAAPPVTDGHAARLAIEYGPGASAEDSEVWPAER